MDLFLTIFVCVVNLTIGVNSLICDNWFCLFLFQILFETRILIEVELGFINFRPYILNRDDHICKVSKS
jgi:hypothetical protein